ncbi:MAG: hypothetical protein K2X56_13760, partial [Mycobacterium pseudokansasii]|uniref:hypothetical protein n=1 Tax=Mycobacterium pseudokansasii TaxID=2341080 RepID=UPI0023F329FB
SNSCWVSSALWLTADAAAPTPRQPPPYVAAPLAAEAATTACKFAACALSVSAYANVDAGPDPDANAV